MKTVLFNSFFLACLYSCIFMLPACESGNASSPDDNGQQDVYEDESTTTDNTADVNPPDEVDPLDEVDPPDELVVDTEPEADVGEDPLEEYYWL
ncbi:hypothetical protein HQ571_06140 [Candidatus Kuenenbacteria bacterium]|nr:hypothetical protein [Candidatus Kuenenbacteria bacterium]